MMSLTTRLTYWLARKAAAAAVLPFAPSWVKTSFLEPSFDRLVSQGYALNAAVNICITKLALAYQQPRPVLTRPDGELAPNHPLQKLLDRPNSDMSWQELALFISTYKAIGGQCYLKKERNGGGLPIALRPYHAGQITACPGEYSWISHYEYDAGDGRKVQIAREDIVHLKWPSVDPSQPWLALPPLRAIAREVDSDTEATRYMYALLFNDATPRTALKIPAGNRPLLPMEVERAKAQFAERHGGDNRGGVVLLENGADIVRVSLNLQELAFDALRRVPESRIAAGFLVPIEVSGLTTGREQSTYNNVVQARRGFFEDTIMPLATLDDAELTADLGAEFGGGVVVGRDYSQVVALRENEDSKANRIYIGWQEGLLGRRESRRGLGLPEELPPDDEYKDGMDVAPPSSDGTTPGDQQVKDTPILGYHIESGVVSRNEARAQLGLPAEDQSSDEKLRRLMVQLAVVQAAVNAGIPTDIALPLVGLDIKLPASPSPAPLKSYPLPIVAKALKATGTEAIEREMAARVQRYLLDQYEAAASAIGGG